MNYQEAADIRALIGFAQLLARKQLEHYIASNRESEKISDGDEVCANCRKFHQHYVITCRRGLFFLSEMGIAARAGEGFK